MSNNKLPRSKNALQSGAYSRDTVLPWESATDYQKHRASIRADLRPEGKIVSGMVDDYAENRWIRRRTRRMTAVATWRHPFGKALQKSGARSWQDVLDIASKQTASIGRPLESVDQSLGQIAQSIKDLAEKVEEEDETDLREDLQKIVDGCNHSFRRLERIKDGVDQVNEFFREYSPKRLHKRILLENALDAQSDKLLARIEIEGERRRIRQKTAGNSPIKELNGADEALVSTVAGDQPQSKETAGSVDLAELDRDDDWDESSAGDVDILEQFARGGGADD